MNPRPIPRDLCGYTVEDLLPLSGDPPALSLTGHSAPYSLPTLGAVASALGKTDRGVIALIIGSMGHIVPQEHAFRQKGDIEGIQALVTMEFGQFTWEEEAVAALLVCQGGPVVTRMLHSLTFNHHGVKAMRIDQETRQAMAPAPSMTQLTRITQVRVLAYLSSEDGLHHVLTDPDLSKADKIVSTYVSLFPYIRNMLPENVALVDYPRAPSVEAAGVGLPALLQGNMDGGAFLVMLGIHILGPAYTNAQRVKEQLSHRIKAVAATLQLEAPEVAAVNDAIVATNWITTDIPPVVEDVMGKAVCLTQEGISSPEATVEQLADPEVIQVEHGLSAIARELLAQARLVFTRYRSTSLGFLPPAVHALKAQMGDNLQAYEAELTRYNDIEPIILSAPYMRFRGSLPERYHIKNMPRLVY